MKWSWPSIEHTANLYIFYNYLINSALLNQLLMLTVSLLIELLLLID